MANEKKKITDEELEKVNGGYFVFGNGNSTGGGTAPSGKVYTYTHYCKTCKKSWQDKTAQATCSCGSTDVYTVSD